MSLSKRVDRLRAGLGYFCPRCKGPLEALDAAQLDQLVAEISIPTLRALHTAISDRLAAAGIVGGIQLERLTVDELRFLRELARKYGEQDEQE